MHACSRLLLTLLLACGFALSPFRLGLVDGILPKPGFSIAHAESGKGKGGDGNRSEDEDDDEEDDAEDEEDDSEDDEGGGNDDENDDESDGGGDDGNGSSEDDAEDGSSGSSGGGGGGSTSTNSESATPPKQTSGDGTQGTWRPKGAISRIEVSQSGIEIRYADGAREMIENGTYELRDPSGRRVEKRRATGTDVARLKAISEGVSIRSVIRRAPRQSEIRDIEQSGRSISVIYSNGWTEEVKGGLYRLSDPFNRIVVARPATRADRNRLGRLAQAN